MFFAAKHAAERKIAEKEEKARAYRNKLIEQGRAQGFAEGRAAGRSEERKRIIRELDLSGNLTPELARIVNNETDARSKGRYDERERIIKKLEQSGNFTPEIARIVNALPDDRP